MQKKAVELCVSSDTYTHTHTTYLRIKKWFFLSTR